jgi:hypothetical protein
MDIPHSFEAGRRILTCIYMICWLSSIRGQPFLYIFFRIMDPVYISSHILPL